MEIHWQRQHELLQRLSEEADLLAGLEPQTIGFFHALPLPAWIKRANPEDPDMPFTMDMVNSAYERAFGISARQYQNNIDSKKWAAEEAAAFHKNDSTAIKEGRVVNCVETILNPKHNRTEDLSIQKFPIPSAHGTLYVGGIVLEIKVREDD